MDEELHVPESYQDHPLVVGGDARNEWFRRLRRETWEDFRECSSSDIKSMVEWMSDRWRKWEEGAENLANKKPELAFDKLIRAWRVRYKLGALTSLLDHIAVHGPHDIPSWEDRPEEARHEDLEGLTPFLPEATLETARERRQMHGEFWSRRENGESAAKLKEELAESFHCSEGTVEEAVYPKNP